VSWSKKGEDGFNYYESKHTNHYFLVDDDAPEVNGFNPKEYNKRILAAIRQELHSTDIINQPLLQNLLAYMREQLHYYLKDWEEHYYVRPEIFGNHEGAIFPAELVAQSDNEETSEEYERLPPNFFLHPKYDGRLEDIERETLWDLNKIKFVDTGVQSETMQDLQVNQIAFILR